MNSCVVFCFFLRGNYFNIVLWHFILLCLVILIWFNEPLFWMSIPKLDFSRLNCDILDVIVSYSRVIIRVSFDK